MPWARNSAPPSFLASSSNTSMKSAPMVLRFASGSVMPASAREEALAGVDVHQRDVEVAAEQRHDLLGLVEPQQAVVDEDAGELVADRLVDQHGGHRAVDAAGEAADDAALADLGADLGDLARLEVRHGPVARQAGDAAHEVADQLAARAACAPPRGGTARRRACASRRRWRRTARPSTRRPP